MSAGSLSPFRSAGRIFLLGLVLVARPSVPQSSGSAQQTEVQKLEFDVASVRQNKSAPASTANEPASNVPLGPGDVYLPTGGELTASKFPLLTYVAFAYRMTDGQLESFRAQVPAWVIEDRFDIQARTENHDVSKDQLRLMMRSLLAERFKLAVHYETKETSVFVLKPGKPGVLGPKLRQHPRIATCSDAAWSPRAGETGPDSKAPETDDRGFPMVCGGIVGLPASAPDRYRIGGSNVRMSLIANSLAGWGELGRPVLDETGLSETYDFSLEFTPEALRGKLSAVSGDSGGPTFLEALKRQLGLKIEVQRRPVKILLLDHVEHVTEN